MRNVKKITYYAVGIALFVALGCAMPIPIPNTTAHVDSGYIVLAVYAYLFGPVAGAVIGGFGRFFEDMLLFGTIGSPGWLIASILMGFLIGLVHTMIDKKNPGKKSALIVSIILDSIILAILLIGLAPFISSIYHGVPYVTKMPSGISAFLTNTVSIVVIGIPLGKLLEKLLPQFLSKE